MEGKGREGREGSQSVEGLVNWLTSFEETLPISADKETPINVGTQVRLRVCAQKCGAWEKTGVNMVETSGKVSPPKVEGSIEK